MQTYRFDPEHLPDRRRSVIRRMAMVYAFVVPSMLLMTYAMKGHLSLGTSVFGIAFCTFGIVYAARTTLAKIAANYENLRVEPRPGQLTVRPSGGPGLTLHQEDVQSIQETKDGSLLVRGRTAQETICLPTDLLGHDELRTELEAWREIEPFRQTWTPRSIGMILGAVALVLPFVAPFVMPESAMSWGAPLVMVLYISAMGAVCFLAIKRTEKKWVRVVGSIALGILSIGMLGALVHLVRAI